MSVVISDTSPINYLILIEEIEILPRLYQEILVPPAVHRELLHLKAPPMVRTWALNPPGWIHIELPATLLTGFLLDQGELEAISLARQETDSLLLMDERKGRRAAAQLGLKAAGTLNILEEADIAGLLDFQTAVAKLQRTSFRIHPELLVEFSQRVEARRQSG